MTGKVSGRIRSLIIKQMQGPLNAEESKELDSLTKDDHSLQELVRRFSDEQAFDTLFKNYLAERDAIKLALDQRNPLVTSSSRSPRRWLYMAVAASILLLIISSIFLLLRQGDKPVQERTNYLVADKAPGKQRATLTLANHTTVDLSAAPEGTIVSKDSNVAIKKTRAGSLEYAQARGMSSGLHVLRTPRGGFFTVQLSDGTKVFLNAASALTYPEVFPKENRLVQLSGEAYFEVAKDKHRPFHVQLEDGMIVQVVGTRFNCFAYQDEDYSQTTLLEGEVHITGGSAGSSILVLRPGQQAERMNGAKQVLVKPVDAEQAIAWVGGSFYFNRVSLPVVFRQLERWYDIHFSYAPALIKQAGNFKGDFERNIPLSGVLSKLEFVSGLHFSLSGNTVTVSK